MTIRQAAKILLEFSHRTRSRPGTCYGGDSDIYECACCRHALNVGSGEHAADCRLAEAMKVIGEDES